jgi:hypothetical protein
MHLLNLLNLLKSDHLLHAFDGVHI